MRCNTCYFFAVHSPGGDDAPGECHRLPPQVAVLPVRVSALTQEVAMHPVAVFPTVTPDSWCGEFSENPNKQNNKSGPSLKLV